MGSAARSRKEAASTPRTIEHRTAVRRLEAAMIEQSRVGEVLERSSGTSSEQPAYARARAAALNVSACDEAVKALANQPPA
jgi:hypothetical protein